MIYKYSGNKISKFPKNLNFQISSKFQKKIYKLIKKSQYFKNFKKFQNFHKISKLTYFIRLKKIPMIGSFIYHGQKIEQNK
jgi:hypothetical protein